MKVSVMKSEGCRTSTKIPVCIVEDHCEVLPFIYRLIGSKRLPLDNMSLVHFDAHSDLSVPPISADSVFNKEELFSNVSIESWILPMVYAGHISSVAWLTPFWAAHSFTEESNFRVGKDPVTEQIRVTSCDNYFLSELAHCAESELTNCQPLSLHVITLADNNCCVHAASNDLSEHQFHSSVQKSSPVNMHRADLGMNRSRCSGNCDRCVTGSESIETPLDDKKCFIDDKCTVDSTMAAGDLTAVSRLSAMLQQHCQPRCFILDVDLDFFSTINPFLTTYTAQQYQLLSELYAYTPPLDRSAQNVDRCKAERKAQLSYLKHVLDCAQQGQVSHLTDCRRDQLLRQLFNSIKRPSNDAVCQDTGTSVVLDATFDYCWLHEVGSGIDDCPLPHHVSSTLQIVQLVEHVKSLITTLPRPAAVTIARSSGDDAYCPPHQVDFIQASVIDMLQTVYGDLDIKLNYTVDSEHS